MIIFNVLEQHYNQRYHEITIHWKYQPYKGSITSERKCIIKQPQETHEILPCGNLYKEKDPSNIFLNMREFQYEKIQQALTKEDIKVQNPNQRGYHNQKKRTCKQVCNAKKVDVEVRHHCRDKITSALVLEQVRQH